jgi:hypothetical protein
MKISRYNPITFDLISEDVTGLDFGRVTLGNFCAQTMVIKPVAESEELTLLGLYLENRAGVDHTRFGLYKSHTSATGILPGDSRLNTYLLEAPGVSDYYQYSDYRITYDANNPEYTWLDAKVGTNETVFGASTINYRFVFEYV